MATFECKTKEHHGNFLALLTKIDWYDLKLDGKFTKFTSFTDTIVMCGLVSVQFKATGMEYDSLNGIGNTAIILKKTQKNDPLNYLIKVTIGSKEEPIYLNEDTSEIIRNIHCWNDHYNNCIDVKIAMDIISIPKCQLFYEDTELTDFQLIGADGSIQVHRLLLANYSPVMKTMLAGSWKEVKEGNMEITTTINTLTHLKEYMYLDKLPDSYVELESLLAIADCYQMSDLVQKCCTKLLFILNEDNRVNMLNLALKYKSKRLIVGIKQEPINLEAIFLNENWL